jgi:hypothetical protein
MNVFVSQMARLGPQIVQFQVGFRSYLATPDQVGPNWGLRFAVTLLFPKK